MSEFLRPLSAEEFTTGMQLRLDIGKIAVGDVCKIRFETQGLEALDPSSRKYFEAAINCRSSSGSPIRGAPLCVSRDAAVRRRQPLL